MARWTDAWNKMSDERLKMVFGFCILVELGILATIVGLGKVEMQTSYGLNIILGSLATLSGMFAQWAFGNKVEQNNKVIEMVAKLTERLDKMEKAA